MLGVAGALVSTPGLTRASPWSPGPAQGAFCPVQSPGSSHGSFIAANPDARLSTDPRASAADHAPVVTEDSLLAPASAICRPKPDTTPSQSSVQP